MGKFESNQRQSAKRKTRPNLHRLMLSAVVLVLVLLLAFLIRLIPVLEREQLPEITGPTSGTVPTEQPGVWTEPEEEEPVLLQDGLQIRCVSRYAGIYMEDGSDEIVSDVMMLILENTSQADLQLARIEIGYSGFTAEFEATNVPAGASVVLLEKNRHAAMDEEYRFVETKNVVFFQEPMSLQEDRVAISGHNGMIEITNISDADLAGDIYIYYKNSAGELLYGGITYRARVEGGLRAGETSRVMTGHYIPEQCTILAVVGGE